MIAGRQVYPQHRPAFDTPRTVVGNVRHRFLRLRVPAESVAPPVEARHDDGFPWANVIRVVRNNRAIVVVRPSPAEERSTSPGHAAVALIWDDEDFPRSFLIIGPRARSTLRLTFEADDIRMLSAALQQAVNDLNKGKSRSAKVKKP